MSAVKERILGVVAAMNENEAQILWNMITQTFGVNWKNIEEIKPDEWDMKMLHDIKSNPECHEFVPEENAMKELGLA